MPAAYAHYCFGKEVYKELPEEEKEWIREGKSVKYYLPDSVISYIQEQKIYQD